MMGSATNSKQSVQLSGSLTRTEDDLKPAISQGVMAWSGLSIVWGTLTVVAFLLTVWAVASSPPASNSALTGGPFWEIYPAWAGAAVLAALSLLVENRVVRLMSVLMFGVVVMGLLGYLEPYGVFHDSWRNVGLGQLTLDPQYSVQALNNPYVAGSPIGFVLLGVIRLTMPDTATMLRLYPLLTVLGYCVGVYQMALAFVDTHFPAYAKGPATAAHRVRFGLLSVFAFLSIASVFSVRVNPAPQSVAFALMPFFVAALLRSRQKTIYRITALLLVGLMVLIHPITSVMVILIGASFFASDLVVRSAKQRVSVVSSNTVILYVTLFVTWLIYIGVWVVKAGEGFAKRLLSVLNGGQTAVTSASGTYVSWDFVWTHRVAMALTGLFMILGLVVAWKANRDAGARLLAWFAVTAIWLPFIFLGEFGDRGPLFASLPASLAIAFLLNMRIMGRSTRQYAVKRKLAKALIVAGAITLATVSFATSYPNHIGEIITSQELDGFHAIAAKAGTEEITYGYMAPLSENDLYLYASDQLTAFATGAADFSYNKLLKAQGVIVVSENMRQAAQVRGTKPLAEYNLFVQRLQDPARYSLVYTNGFVSAYHAR